MILRRFALPLVLLVAALLAMCGLAVAATSYRDPGGDVKGGGGPDIISLKVSNTPSTITFRIRFAETPPLRISTRERWVDMLLIGIDVPPLGPRPAAPGGEWRGADFALGTHGPSKTGRLVRLGKRTARVATFEIVTAGPTVTFSVARRALDNPAWFAFNVAAAREQNEGTGGGVDVSPDRGTFRYVLTG